MATERSFPVAWKPSSSGLCFITSSVKDYLDEFSHINAGPIYDACDGMKKIGEHKGIQFYTIGQRKGLGLYHSHLVRFVIDLRAEDNAVIVGSREMCQWTKLSANRANFFTEVDKVPKKVLAQTRYRQKPIPANLIVEDDAFRLEFEQPVFAVTIGQSAVIYDGDKLLGGGVITSRS
jgi:tRNA-specific 2-thiouridylase